MGLSISTPSVLSSLFPFWPNVALAPSTTTKTFSQLSENPVYFGIDVGSGFLPPSPPLTRLPSGPQEVWEDAWDATDGLRAGLGEGKELTRLWRTGIRERMPLVGIDELKGSMEQLRRAHAVLAGLVHAYVHTEAAGFKEEVVVPKALAVPLCAVSELLDVPPILCYSDTVLYNWTWKDPSMGFAPGNIVMPLNFTRTDSELHFHRIGFQVETFGPDCLALMRASCDETSLGHALSVTRISHHLLELASLIDRLRLLFDSVRDGCDPRTFYWEIRPFFNGGKWTMEAVEPLAHDEEASPAGWRVTNFAGPSGGQSTLIHAIDVFLGIDHRPRSRRGTSPHGNGGSSPNPTQPSADGLLPPPLGVSSPMVEETFMERMAYYMPQHHRLFLQQLAGSPAPGPVANNYPHLPKSTQSIRSLALASPPGSPFCLAYDTAVKALEGLRNSHSRVVMLYIISQSRVEPPAGSGFWNVWKATMDAEWERAESRRMGDTAKVEEAVHKGTGERIWHGFLKRCRDRTREALVGENLQRVRTKNLTSN